MIGALPSLPVSRSGAPVRAPLRPGCVYLVILRDGWAKADDGFVYPRWALCSSLDGDRPVRRYRNGGPVALLRTSAMRAAPDWQARAAAFARAFGGVPADLAAEVADWYRHHRDGAYPGDIGGAA
ncbi:MAG: hypothetical protein FJ090_23190 [Deltaproteobacteria bacterium]|nr:hypothetical protein [Deltaproteobacteria bacterium]